MLRSAHRARGVERQDLADDEPVKQHPKGCEVLLDGRRREHGGELLDVGRDHHGLDFVEAEASALAPLGEAAHGREVREARVGVSDVGGEELPEAPLRARGGGEERRGRRAARGRDGAGGGLDGEQVGGTWRGSVRGLWWCIKGTLCYLFFNNLKHPSGRLLPPLLVGLATDASPPARTGLSRLRRPSAETPAHDAPSSRASRP